MMTRVFVYASIVASASALAGGLALNGYISPAISIALLGVAWIVAYARRLSWMSAIVFALFTFFAILSLWSKTSPWLAFACMVFSLSAWDLAKFVQRLDLTADKTDSQKMERAHFLRLGLVIGLGAMGFAAATQLRISLTFGGAAILSLLGIWGVSALIYNLRSRE